MLFLQGNGKQIVPIVGWSQGVFRIENLAGRQIVTDSDGNQVLGIVDNTIVKRPAFHPRRTSSAAHNRRSKPIKLAHRWASAAPHRRKAMPARGTTWPRT